jgi:hypothetical protein
MNGLTNAAETNAQACDTDPRVILNNRRQAIMSVRDGRTDPIKARPIRKPGIHVPPVMANHFPYERLSMPDPQLPKVKSRIADLGIGPIDYTRDSAALFAGKPQFGLLPCGSLAGSRLSSTGGTSAETQSPSLIVLPSQAISLATAWSGLAPKIRMRPR